MVLFETRNDWPRFPNGLSKVYCSLLLAFTLVISSAVFIMGSNGPNNSNKSPSDKTILIVGGGMAGLAAAVEATKSGAKVIVIEGQKTTGGNSAKATSGINGCQTKAQQALGVKDSHDLFFDDTLRAGHNENDRALVDVLVHHAAESIGFLDALGTNLDEVSIGGGHSVPRTHAFKMPPDGKLKPFGATVMRTVFNKLQEFKSSYESLDLHDRLQFLLETRVESLLTTTTTPSTEQQVDKTLTSTEAPVRVVGVRLRSTDGTTRDLQADAVILATGGFCNDHDSETSLLARYAGDKIKYPTTNGPFADGSGMKMAEKIGARLIDMEKIQIHPTGFIDHSDPKAKTKFLAAEALRGAGAILLNEKGRRFANELGLRDYLTDEILKHCSLNETTGTHTAFMVLNQQSVDKFGRPAFEFYWKAKKFFKMADNVEGLARLIGVPADTLRQTFSDYSKAASANKESRDKSESTTITTYGKKTYPVVFDENETLYVGVITPVLHYSMGGVKVNEAAQVLYGGGGGRDSSSSSSSATVADGEQKPIRGLYAAGEVIGGVHGGNRLSGNSYLDCVVFGRLAGQHAAYD